MRYVALLRGIGPINPNMKNVNLRRVAEAEGLADVSTVISSGNVVFDSSRRAHTIEALLEAAWPRELGFTSTTIIRSQSEIEALIAAEPFGDLEHGRNTALEVTFSKLPLNPVEVQSLRSGDASEYVAGATDREVFTVTDRRHVTTPTIMSKLNRALGTTITTRTWLTVRRIRKKMNDA